MPRPAALPQGLQDVYGLQFARFEAMPSRTTTADALETGEIDLGMLETTNGNLADRDLVQLTDDRRLQPAENIAPMMRTNTVTAYGPTLVRVINNLTAQLNTQDLIQMNQQVELEGRSPRRWLPTGYATTQSTAEPHRRRGNASVATKSGSDSAKDFGAPGHRRSEHPPSPLTVGIQLKKAGRQSGVAASLMVPEGTALTPATAKENVNFGLTVGGHLRQRRSAQRFPAVC